MSKSLLEGMLSSGDKDCTAEMMMDMIETALTLFNVRHNCVCFVWCYL